MGLIEEDISNTICKFDTDTKHHSTTKTYDFIYTHPQLPSKQLPFDF